MFIEPTETGEALDLGLGTCDDYPPNVNEHDRICYSGNDNRREEITINLGSSKATRPYYQIELWPNIAGVPLLFTWSYDETC